MIAFPLENVEYTAESLGAWFAGRSRGVFSTNENFAVTANGNMKITVKPGIAWLKPSEYWGTVVYERGITELLLEPYKVDGVLSCYSAVCLQLDKNANKASLKLKFGKYEQTPALSSLPLPARDKDYDEIYIAAIYVRAGAISITQADITDLRSNETYCGIMRDGVTGIPSQMMYDQFVAILGELQEFSTQKTQQIQDILAGVQDGTQYMLTGFYDQVKAVRGAGGFVEYIDMRRKRIGKAAQNFWATPPFVMPTLQLDDAVIQNSSGQVLGLHGMNENEKTMELSALE